MGRKRVDRRVLGCLELAGERGASGLEISRASGLYGGTIYAACQRLMLDGTIVSVREVDGEGRDGPRVYCLQLEGRSGVEDEGAGCNDFESYPPVGEVDFPQVNGSTIEGGQ